jgi:hypothetical protein
VIGRKPLTGLHYGDRIKIDLPELDEPATGTYIGYAGGPHALVRLDGTEELVNIPRGWIERDDSLNRAL